MGLLDNDTVPLWRVSVTLTKESGKEDRNIFHVKEIILCG